MEDLTSTIIVSMPVEMKVQTVPHFTAPINSKVEPWGLEGDGIFMKWNSIVNLSRLVHKTGFFETEAVATVLRNWELVDQN